MTARWLSVATAAPAGVLALVFGYNPVYLLALFCGAVLPDVDAFDRRFHRSWLFHTYLAPTIAFVLVALTGFGPAVVVVIHFLTLGMTAHFVCDFVYPKRRTHEGAEWPVRPTVWSAPWGLMWLGLAWFAQWFLYLVPAFFPWMLGISP